MTKAFWYWLLMFFWLIFGVWTAWPSVEAERYAPLGGSLLLFALLTLVGLKVFGSPVKD